jgi:hypothetical protein
MKRQGINPTSECPLYSEHVPDFAALEEISLPSAHTVLLIAADARGVSTDVIASVAARLLSAGLIYICVWGPDCERVHDVFDEVYVGDGCTEPDFTLMSTWHDDESLDEAVWYFTQCAFPPDTEIEKTSYVAVAVGRPDWAEVINTDLSDVPVFTRRMLDNEEAPTENSG